MKNIASMIKNAKAMQEKFTQMQKELESLTVEGESAAGMVKVTLNGKGDLLSISLNPTVVCNDEIEVLEDLIVAAFSSAKEKLEATTKTHMSDITGGLPQDIFSS